MLRKMGRKTDVESEIPQHRKDHCRWNSGFKAGAIGWLVCARSGDRGFRTAGAPAGRKYGWISLLCDNKFQMIQRFKCEK